jgi:hypothetical protein
LLGYEFALLCCGLLSLFSFFYLQYILALDWHFGIFMHWHFEEEKKYCIFVLAFLWFGLCVGKNFTAKCGLVGFGLIDS